MIRRAVQQDVGMILTMARKFWDSTLYSEPFDAQHTLKMVEYSMQQDLFLVLEIEGRVVGMISAISTFLLASSSSTHAVEIAFYLEPDVRQRNYSTDLIRALEELCKTKGIKYLNLVSMETSAPEVANKIYSGLGYKHSESTFTKILMD